MVSGGHDEEPEDEGEAGGVVHDQLGQVGDQETGDLAPLDPEEDNITWWEDCDSDVLAEITVSVVSSPAGPSRALMVVEGVQED